MAHHDGRRRWRQVRRRSPPVCAKLTPPAPRYAAAAKLKVPVDVESAAEGIAAQTAHCDLRMSSDIDAQQLALITNRMLNQAYAPVTKDVWKANKHRLHGRTIW